MSSHNEINIIIKLLVSNDPIAASLPVCCSMIIYDPGGISVGLIRPAVQLQALIKGFFLAFIQRYVPLARSTWVASPPPLVFAP